MDFNGRFNLEIHKVPDMLVAQSLKKKLEEYMIEKQLRDMV